MLTSDDLRKLLKVEAEIVRILNAAAQAGVRGSSLDSPRGIAAASSYLDADPEATRALSSVEWTGRDFWLTFLAAHGAVTGLMPFGFYPGSAWDGNRQLIRNLPSELAATLAEWKRVRLGPD
jgi:hypothetical protein